MKTLIALKLKLKKQIELIFTAAINYFLFQSFYNFSNAINKH